MAEYIERDALIDDLDAAAKHGGMGAIIAQTLQRYVKRAPAATWLRWCMGGGIIPGDIRSRVVLQPSGVPTAAAH